MSSGSRKGCVIAPYLFNIMVEVVMREVMGRRGAHRRKKINKSEIY